MGYLPDQSLEEILSDSSLVTPDQLVARYPFKNPLQASEHSLPLPFFAQHRPGITSQLPAQIAIHYKIMPVKEEDGQLIITVSGPDMAFDGMTHQHTSANVYTYTLTVTDNDCRQSVRQVTDTYIYEAFGSLVSSSGTTETVYGFMGEQFDDEVGLQYLRARYYDPEVGRFVSRDPILSPIVDVDSNFWFLPYLVNSPQMLHPYVYAANNPVNRVDPEGTVVTVIVGGIIIVVMGTGLLLTWNCLSKWKKWADKVEEFRGTCDTTNDAWEKNKKTKEYRDMIKACGFPTPGM